VKIVLWIVGGIAALLVILTVQFGTLKYLGLMEPEVNGALIVDAKTVVRIFVETRGVDLDDEEMAAAIRSFDTLVMAEAEAIYQGTDRAIINANHILAGGHDISEEFARHVIARWDEVQVIAPTRSLGQLSNE